jgi:putative OPT family oligopeptide transporter
MNHRPAARSDVSPEQPFVSAGEKLPEVTFKAVVLGLALSAFLAAANAYLGLKVGMVVSASIPAAVMSMAILRLFRESNILENNIVQTAASAGEALAAGVIFTVPALIMLPHWTGFEFLPTAAIALCGGVLGVLFTVPLRRALIIEAGLQFPEGIATAEVLKVGTSGGGARDIAFAGIAAALLKLSQTGLKVAASSVDGAVRAGGALFGFGSDLSAALLGVGYIVGLNISVLVFAGGLISWLFGIPIYTAVTDPVDLAEITAGQEGYAAALEIWSQRIRYLGVGAMATGGAWALIALVRPMIDGMRSSLEAFHAGRGPDALAIPRTDRDLPIHFVLMGTVFLAVPVFVVFWHVIDLEALRVSSELYYATVSFGCLFAIVAGFLFSSVAGYMSGLVGSSNNPISGVTIATILTVSLLLLVLLGSEIDFGVDQTRAAAAAATAILVGSVVACAAAIAGDNMQDLKAGYLVGATPRNQQIMQIVGVLAAALVIAPVLQLLFEAYGLGDVFPREGMDPAEALKAPQATLMNSVAYGVFQRDLPWGMIWIGTGVAVVIIAVDKILEIRRSTFRAPVLAVAVGIYLPVELTVPIFAGGLLAHFSRRQVEGRGGDRRLAERRGLLFSSGLITGEAIVGILLAIPFAAFQSTEVLRLVPAPFEPYASVTGVLALSGLGWWLYRVVVRRSVEAGTEL